MITLPIGGSTVPKDVLTKLDGTTPLRDWTHEVSITYLELIPDGDDTEFSFFSLITVIDELSDEPDGGWPEKGFRSLDTEDELSGREEALPDGDEAFPDGDEALSDDDLVEEANTSAGFPCVSTIFNSMEEGMMEKTIDVNIEKRSRSRSIIAKLCLNFRH